MALAESVRSLVVSDTQRRVDLRMVPYDLWATKAHVLMLERQKIISKPVARAILSALNELQQATDAGQFEISPELGAQLTLEKEVVKRAGEEAGLAMHTARSRNDQVMVTETLFLRDEALSILATIVEAAKKLANRALEGAGVPMPGYTHMQPGKPTALSHWFLAHADSLLRSAERLEFTLRQYNLSPLGAVESFGTSWPIDRLFVANLLGFKGVWEIPQDAISNRGAFQLSLLSDFSHCAVAVSRLAVDVLQYSTFEYRYVDFSDEVAARLHPITGSSVMAQKRNPDAAELLRSLAPQIMALEHGVGGILARLPTGYNRDSREVKELATLAIDKMQSALVAFTTLIDSLRFDEKRMLELVNQNYSLTTDLADQLSQHTGQPYRRMYKIVGKAVDELMQAGLPLTKLNAEMLKRRAFELGVELSVTDADVQLGLDVFAALERRNHVGGTKRSVIVNLVRTRLDNIAEFELRLRAVNSGIAAAKSFTAQQVHLSMQQVP